MSLLVFDEASDITPEFWERLTMRTEQSDGVAPGGAHLASNHTWGEPLPGSGSMKVCLSCGEKRTTYTDRAECPGRPSVGISETIHDYNPIS